MSAVATKNVKAEALSGSVIRRHFPIFQHPENRGLVYLDSAATSQKPRPVIDAVSGFYQEINANTHRGAYRLAEKATAAYEQAREKVAGFIGAGSEKEIVFVRNATEAINFVATGWARKFLKPEDEIVVTEMEHHSNLVPWQVTAQKTGAKLRFIEFDEEGKLKLENLDSLINPRTKLVSIIHISNALGTINPIRQIIEAAHRCGALVLVDGAQSVPHTQVNVSEIDADFLAFSGHKMLGPMGIGVLYAKEEHLQNMDPIHFGGEMISDVDYFQSTWNDLPWKFEAGTQNVAGAVGLGAAIDFIESIGIEKIEAHDRDLTAYALDRLRTVDGLRVYGPLQDHGPAISFTLGSVHPHDLSTFLDSRKVAVRSGHHCARLVMKKLRVPATARASFYLYNTREDIDALVNALNEAKDYFRKWT
jgi:cysteine desulfurase/selenocysteine lyase